jgi:hypothetical protein
MVPKEEDPEGSLADAEPGLPQPRLFNVIMRDYKESPSRMMDGLYELDDLDDLDERLTTIWMSGSPWMEAMIWIESSSLVLSLELRICRLESFS